MKLKRKIIKQSTTTRGLIIPSVWFEFLKNDGYEAEEVYLDIQPNLSIIVKPILKKIK